AKARHLVYADQIELPVHMPVYPDELEQWIELRDASKMFMRPLKLTDEPLLRELFYKLSPESVHYRFSRTIKSMPHEKLQEFLRVDYDADMVLVGMPGREEGQPVVAIAHYSKDPRTGLADAAFLVRDDWQGKGVGTALMKTLVEAARAHGVSGFSADVLADNHGMLRVFHRCGFAVESELADGVYHLTIPFGRKRSKRRRRGDSDVR
ncbi:MAG: GNAT family N-acetyltransferase, partial [bacterium]|nr:GNAT family N-acetyltransferase [bacterium]